MSSADNFCKEFGPRSGPTERGAWSGPKLFDTLIVFLKKNLEKKQQRKKKRGKISQGAELKNNLMLMQ